MEFISLIRQLAPSIREYKKTSIITSLFVTVEVIIEVLIPFVMSYLIDYGINKSDMSYILKFGLLLIILSLFALMMGILSGKYAAIASAGYAKNLRKDMYYNVQNFSFNNIDKFSTASIITRLTTDVTNVQNAYQMIIRVAIRSPCMLIFSLIMAFSINQHLSLVFLLAIPILAIGLYLIMKNAHPIFVKVFRTYDKLNNVVQENLHGIRVVKAYVREEHEIYKFKNISKIIYNDFIKAEKIVSFAIPLMIFCMYMSTLFISWFGAQFIANSIMTTGQLVSFLIYIFQILMSLMMLSMVFIMVTIANASAKRIGEILTENSDIVNPSNPIYEIKNGDIRFENVNFSYTNDKNKTCLNDINLDILTGETIGIIGETGSAKTTLMQLIPRLYDTTTGIVTVGDIDVKDYDLESLRNEVGIVLQKNVLFSGTIKENLRWGNKSATDEELVHVCKMVQAHDFIKSFPKGYDTYIEHDGTNISGGQKQRIAIARTLLKNPKILILDDSTSAVDTKTEALIRNALYEYFPKTTKIIVGQRISSIENANKIVILDNGKINAIGTHDELLKSNKIYIEIYNSQIKGGKMNEN